MLMFPFRPVLSKHGRRTTMLASFTVGTIFAASEIARLRGEVLVSDLLFRGSLALTTVLFCVLTFRLVTGRSAGGLEQHFAKSRRAFRIGWIVLVALFTGVSVMALFW
jgi:hypothetical protein